MVLRCRARPQKGAFVFPGRPLTTGVFSGGKTVAACCCAGRVCQRIHHHLYSIHFTIAMLYCQSKTVNKLCPDGEKQGAFFVQFAVAAAPWAAMGQREAPVGHGPTATRALPRRRPVAAREHANEPGRPNKKGRRFGGSAEKARRRTVGRWFLFVSRGKTGRRSCPTAP